MPRMTTWTFAPEPYDSPDAVDLWRAYYTEVSDRWYRLHQGHATDPGELEREIAAASWSELVPPTGSLIVARYAGEAMGCAGVRMLDATTGEVKRVYIRPRARGTGGARPLLRAVEEAGRGLGARRLRLDTRGDLVEARALYAGCGYTEIPPYHDDPYAEHFFEKRITRAQEPPAPRGPGFSV
ncbi:GNAT family N-acetyltransferase [Streptomyces sp. GC420]|uniref:GNAT family N-acetyltransferase n=1 Tax=Streptomyces sp. GC420 TaxID=2697568 RepID=UPI0014150C84|nr:GNAT family N-acetyltransferase [Streptomyces sp. GC420]NBM19677.1 GNAT family N-acetyltransferase [Streptomyces sp. GC420]